MPVLHALKSMDRKRAVFIVCICLLPFLSHLVLPQVFFQRSIADFFPNGWNDQVSYGRQIATVHAVGWEGGYFTVNEQPAAAEFTHFYAHGPLFPVLYGTLSKFTGWTYATGLWFNVVFLSAALAFFIITARLDPKQCFYLAALYLTSWVLHLYSISLMQEAFHHAAALVYAGIFFHLLRRKQNLSGLAIALIILFTLFMGVMRLSWMLLCVPLFLCLIPRRSVSWIIAALFTAGILTGGVYLLANWISAPGANSIATVVTTMQSDLGAGIGLLGEEVSANVNSIIQNIGYSLRGLQFFQILILIGAALFHLIRHIRAPSQTETPVSYWAFVIYALISIIVLSCALYLSNGFLRIFALPLFVCACLLIAFREYRLLLIIIALNSVGGGAFQADYRDHTKNFEFSSTQIQVWQNEASRVLVYQENAPTPWCNTILIDLVLYDYRAALLPPGMGTGWFNDFPQPMKSRYYYSTKRSKRPFLEERAAFSFGGYLYENTAAQTQCMNPQNPRPE